MNILSRAILAIVLALVGGSRAQAALITFSGAVENGQRPITPAYQPLVAGYPGSAGVASDGGPLGVTITWNGAWTSNPVVNGGVHDHTGDTAGVVGYDGGNASFSLTFSQAVSIPSFYYANFNGGGPYSIEFTAYNGSTVVSDHTYQYFQTSGPNGGGYQWIQNTDLAGLSVTQLVIQGDNYKQIDDITVNLPASAVPEPASLSLLAVTVGVYFANRRRRRSA